MDNKYQNQNGFRDNVPNGVTPKDSQSYYDPSYGMTNEQQAYQQQSTQQLYAQAVQNNPRPSPPPHVEALKKLISPFAAEHEEYMGHYTRRDPAFSFIWANEQVKSLIYNQFASKPENANYFTEQNGVWTHTEIRNFKTYNTELFLINIDNICILIDSITNGIICLLILYSTEVLTDIAIVPYEHYKEKKLKEFFRIHQLFRYTPNKSNIINEYLYMQITMNLKQPACLLLYPHQGWNITYDGKPAFISCLNYPKYIINYLNESVKCRDVANNHFQFDNPIEKISEIIPFSFEVKLMLAMRAASLILFMLFKANLLPQQVFLFESSDQLTLSIAAMLLKTNNSFDKVFPSLADKPKKLSEAYSMIYDGIAVTIDHAGISTPQREKGIAAIINDMITNNYAADGARHLHVILSESASYYKDSQSILYLHLPTFTANKNIQSLPQIMHDIDCIILRTIMPTEESEQMLLKIAYEITPSDYNEKYKGISKERRNTYCLIKNGAKLINAIVPDFIDDEFNNKLDSWFKSIDMSGNAHEFDIINIFSKAIDVALDNKNFIFTFITEATVTNDIADEVILHDDEYIFVSSQFIDTYILPAMRDVTHRQLIRALDAGDMIKKSDHFCQRINTRDENGNLKVIYRYAINKSLLNTNKLQQINSTKNNEFFLESADLPKGNFLPLGIDKFSEKHIIRLLESGSKANNHILITGGSGQGKSFAMMRIAAYLAEMDEKVIFLDSNGMEALDELTDSLPNYMVKNDIKIFDLENSEFPIDPFMTYNIKHSDSKANLIANILLSAAYDATIAQADKLKNLLLENSDKIYIDNKVSPKALKELLVNDNSTLSALRDKLNPLLTHIDESSDHNNSAPKKTWKELLDLKQNFLIFSLDAHLEKQGKKLFDILLASLYYYHSKHRDKNIWIFIDEIFDHNLKENGIINSIFTQGRRSRLSIIGATQNYRISRSEEWTTLNNARTKIFFAPHTSSVNDVMTELDMPQSERRLLSQMQIGECIISSELYSKKTKSNQPAIVHGKVPEKYTPFKEILPPPPNYGAGPAAPAEEKKKESIDSVQPDTNPTSPISENDIKFGQNTRIENIPVSQTYKPLYEQEKNNRTSFTVPSWDPSLAEHSYKKLIYLEQNKTHNTNSWIKPYTKDDNNKK